MASQASHSDDLRVIKDSLERIEELLEGKVDGP